MSTGIAMILIVLALALIVSAGVTIPRRRKPRSGLGSAEAPSGQVESELLRRPLRSRQSL